MDPAIRDKLLARPDRNEEEWFATRVLRAAGVTAQEAGARRWAMARKIMSKCLKRMGACSPFIRAIGLQTAAEAVETVRLGTYPDEYGSMALLVRFPGNRTAVFAVTPDMDWLHRFPLPLTIHCSMGDDMGPLIVQMSMDDVLKRVKEMAECDGPSIFLD